LVAAAVGVGEDGLVARWPLTVDASEVVGGLATVNHGVVFDSQQGASFDGRSAWLEAPHSGALNLDGDFTAGVWVHTAAVLDDTLGDILSKFDPAARRGLNFGVMNYHGVVDAQSNYRNVFFGLDDGSSGGPWADCGRPGNSVYVMSLCVYDGGLYAGTFEIGKDETGHVYRYKGANSGTLPTTAGERPNEWEDCGAPYPSNAVSALAVHDGALYAAASNYRSRGSALGDSENALLGGRVYRYRGGAAWDDCGKLGEIEAVYGLASFNGKLYASSLYAPAGLFRYEGGTTWTDLGNPGGRIEALGVHNGHLYGTGFDENFAGVYRFDDPGWTDCGAPPDTTQTYSFMQYGGELYVGSWPSGKVFLLSGPGAWEDRGRLGEEREVMGMAVYNGMLYAGTLPLAHVYRYDGGTTWTSTGRIDTTPDVTYRRAWSMAVYNGALFCGVLPSGRVWRYESGRCVSNDRALPPGWVHLAVRRQDAALSLFENGKLVAERADAAIPFDNAAPLRIGFGQHDYFNGRMRDLRLYNKALAESEIAAMADRRSPIANCYDSVASRPKLPVDQAWLYRPETEWTYSHHPSVAWHGGRYYAMWSNGRKDEDAPGQRVLYSTSEDFANWTDPVPLVDTRMGEHSELVLTAGGFHSHGETLTAYFGQWEYSPEALAGNSRPNSDTAHRNVRLNAITTEDGAHWSAPIDLGLPVVSNHPPTATRSGRLILCGHTAYPYTDDPGGLTGWRMTGIYPPEMAAGLFDDSEGFHLVRKKTGWPAGGLCEGSFYQTDDAVLHMLLRSGTDRLWVTESGDDGATWSPPVPTEFTDNVAKFHLGRLPDGRFYYVGNPDPEPRGRRNPLVLSISNDGVRFDAHYILADAEYQASQPGKYKGGTYAYPHSLIYDGHLCVIVSVGKESVLALRVKLSELGAT
jgi:hypothetical protein